MKKDKKILILGNGAMGRVVYHKLSLNYDTYAADIRHSGGWGKFLYKLDFSSVAAISELIQKLNPDIVVGCAPAKFGRNCMEAIVNCDVDYVDISFGDFDPFEFQWKTKNLIIPDAGLAPGLTNLFVGRELFLRDLSHIYIYMAVGGVSKSPFAPYGYAVSWSVEDMMSEFYRPARYVLDGNIYEELPLEEFDKNFAEDLDEINIDGHTVMMESFISDGLRTLLRYKDKVFGMSERTLRWPGHIKSIKKLLEEGTFVETIKENCWKQDDTVVFNIKFMNDKEDKIITMVDHIFGDTAMARTTAYTCAAVTDMILKGIYSEPGIHPLEDVGQNEEAFKFIIDSLRGSGIIFHERIEE